ncbi:MAG TPA: hypothetical protein PLZ93_02240 [Nocardioides sp.]|nr:hypothetical protein [uncultured Nocardioides sp.]HRD61329.1 hypothetical protein [Nocardioides sp.]HRI94415.1 hypothetical protein [Nocardioides sp.]HRK44339.1 hypothetical protein [Nocardioides sp.]
MAPPENREGRPGTNRAATISTIKTESIVPITVDNTVTLAEMVL